MKRLSRRQQQEHADVLFSRYIRARDGHCVACGSDVFLQCAHVISRSYHAIRWDETNAVCLCRSCHTRYTHKPLEWEQWARAWIGDEAYDLLRHKALSRGKVDYESVLAWLREEVA